MIETVADLRNAAADVLNRDGWCRGRFKDEADHRCVAGALIAALREHGRDSKSDVYGQTLRMLRHETGMEVAMWNDNVCTTREQAVSLLRSGTPGR